MKSCRKLKTKQDKQRIRSKDELKTTKAAEKETCEKELFQC
jgi:hypothetical protein